MERNSRHGLGAAFWVALATQSFEQAFAERRCDVREIGAASLVNVRALNQEGQRCIQAVTSELPPPRPRRFCRDRACCQDITAHKVACHRNDGVGLARCVDHNPRRVSNRDLNRCGAQQLRGHARSDDCGHSLSKEFFDPSTYICVTGDGTAVRRASARDECAECQKRRRHGRRRWGRRRGRWRRWWRRRWWRR